MTPVGTGDLARSLLLNRTGTQQRVTLSRLTQELSTGQHADTSRALGGALMPLADAVQGIELSKRHAKSAKVAATILSAQSAASSGLAGRVSDLALDMRTSASAAADKRSLSSSGARALSAFIDSIALLNTKVAGRHVFAGASSDRKPLESADSILGALVSGIPADASVAEVKDHVATWFKPGGGFDTAAYSGGAAVRTNLDLGSGYRVRLDVTATETAFRDSLAGLALGAMAALMSSRLSAADQRNLLSASSDVLMASESNLISLQTRLGSAEARVEEAQVEAQTRGAALEIVRSELLEADPYETATALEAATQRLDALFLVTSRLSRLSLTEYLR